MINIHLETLRDGVRDVSLCLLILHGVLVQFPVLHKSEIIAQVCSSSMYELVAEEQKFNINLAI